MVHKLKIKEPFADAVVQGRKTFEIRNNDRGYQTGDTIRFQAVDDVGLLLVSHPINRRPYAISYVLSGWGLKDGYVALAIAETSEAEGGE